MTPLTKSDLLHCAQQLPKIDFLNHEEQVLTNYERGGWEKVSDYCLFVHQLEYSLRQNESRRATLINKLTTYTKRIESWLKNRLNNFQYD